jgi:hypothetical protein
MRGTDEALSSIIRRRLDKILAERDRDASSSFNERVRRIMFERVGKSTLTPEMVASTLAVSQRTLSRRLADERTSFRNILDDGARSSLAPCCRIAA